MELKLTKAEIEAILLGHVNRIVPEAGMNRIEWDCGYRSVENATFDHTDVPQENDGE